MKIAIAGCGALGSQIALGIATPETELTLFDFDMVSEENVLTGTSAYYREDIGTYKTFALAGMLFHKFGIEAECKNRRVENPYALSNFDLVVDCFDNVGSRLFTYGLETVHVGVSPQFIGSVTWDNEWQLPSVDHEQNPICTHQVGRNILGLTSAVAIVLINHWIDTGEQINRTVKGWEIF